ncbi:MAG TPA: RNA polymerase sigma factor [Verrucomicrobiales bacterium]|nr:RNA polymerase sigma factor [Verrucomicrobiales bacterium]HIL70311.1 RNA polymerase sigma factor [Verrucomicrobiota bacterium]
MSDLFNPKQISQWYEEHYSNLALYCRQWLPQSEIEDAIQEVFLKIVQKRITPENVKAWLFRSIRNASLNRLRTGKRRTHREKETMSLADSWFEDRPDDQIDSETAQTALNELKADEREIVILRIWGETTFEEIADICAISTATAFRKYQSGLDTLRNRMEKPCRKHQK